MSSAIHLKHVFRVILVVAFYWATSICMTFINKYLVGDALSGTKDMSLFIAWIQCLISVLVFVVTHFIRRIYETSVGNSTSNSNQVNHSVAPPSLPPSINRSAKLSSSAPPHRSLAGTLRLLAHPRILLQCSAYVFMLTFNNLTLKHVGVASFQLARSLNLAFTVLLSAPILHARPSRTALLCCVLVCAGFALGFHNNSNNNNNNNRLHHHHLYAATLRPFSGSMENSQNKAGLPRNHYKNSKLSPSSLSLSSLPSSSPSVASPLIFGVLASLCVALNGILTKLNLPLTDLSSFSNTLLLNSGAVLLFPLLLVPLGQLHFHFAASPALSPSLSPALSATHAHTHPTHFLGALLLSGLVGCLLSYASNLQINFTSPLAHHISNNAKSVCITLAAVLYFSEIKPALWWLGNLLVIVASVAFGWSRAVASSSSSSSASSSAPSLSSPSSASSSGHSLMKTVLPEFLNKTSNSTNSQNPPNSDSKA